MTSTILPTSKANYPKGILPAFYSPELTPEVIERYKDQIFTVCVLPSGGLPVVIVIYPDRLHVYNDITELKYSAFNQDIYAKAIGEHEVALRSTLHGNALFGWIYQECTKNIQVFHIWSTIKSVWLDSRQIEVLRRTEPNFAQKIRLPQVEAMDTLGTLTKSYIFDPDKGLGKMWLFVKSINDPGLFFVQKQN